MKILLATDGSDSANTAIDYLRAFPLPPDSEVILMTVIEKEVYHSRKKAELNAEQLELLQQTKRMLKGKARELLEAARQRLGDQLRSGVTLIRSGHPAREIVRAAKKREVDLVVVGSHGLGGIKRFLLGSISDQVLAYAHCSVLIVRPSPAAATTAEESAEEASPGAAHWLLAYDDSPSAREAAAFCAALPMDPATRITLLTVLPLMTLYRQGIKQRLSWVWQEKKKSSQKALEHLAAETPWVTRQVTTRLLEAPDVSQTLLEQAEQSHSELIVLGHKGKGAIQKFLLGSVTRRIAHHAPCSVLAVRGTRSGR